LFYVRPGRTARFRLIEIRNRSPLRPLVFLICQITSLLILTASQAHRLTFCEAVSSTDRLPDEGARTTKHKADLPWVEEFLLSAYTEREMPGSRADLN